jgi:tetratricopeptide (TPR) repeat protein
MTAKLQTEPKLLFTLSRGPTFFSVLAAFLFLFSLSSCRLSQDKIEFEKGQTASDAKNYRGALEHFDHVVKRQVNTELAIEAAKEAARVSYYELKDYKAASGYFQHIILYSTASADRIEAQKKIAELNFSNLQDYKQAILEYNKLLQLPHSSREEFEYRLAIARSFFYQNNFFQALVEADQILKQAGDAEDVFDAMELKANILMQTKKHDEAVEVLKLMTSKYPEKSKERQTGLLLAVVYEEKKDFAKAIETLTTIKDTYPSPAFIEARIKDLKERQSYLPGARGWHK